MDHLISLVHMQPDKADSLEEILTAKLELYILLYKTVSCTESDSTVTEGAMQSMEEWAKKYNENGKQMSSLCTKRRYK